MKRLVLAATALALAVPAAAGTSRITVLAASSLTDAFPRIDRTPRYAFGGSDQLAFQIRQGAPADVFAAASAKYTQQLYRAGLVLEPAVFATNSLVVIVPRSNPAGISAVRDVARKGVKLVVAADGVPLGDYTRKVLSRLRLKRALQNVVSEEPDARGVVAKVALGEADAGFVYATDVRAVATKLGTVPIPARAQPTVRYEIAVVRSTSRLAAARAFVRRVLGSQGRRELRRLGFGLP